MWFCLLVFQSIFEISVVKLKRRNQKCAHLKKFSIKSRHLLELGVRASTRRDVCWPVGWEGPVGRESILLFLGIFESKMTVLVAVLLKMMTVVGMVVFMHK